MPGVSGVNGVKTVINKGKARGLSQFQKKVQVLEKQFCNHCECLKDGSKTGSLDKIG